MTTAELTDHLLEIGTQLLAKGVGYAQENVVLREAAEQLHIEELSDQQRLLTAWQDLFRKGTLSWGYDVDNPNYPFFHVAER